MVILLFLSNILLRTTKSCRLLNGSLAICVKHITSNDVLWVSFDQYELSAIRYDHTLHKVFEMR